MPSTLNASVRKWHVIIALLGAPAVGLAQEAMEKPAIVRPDHLVATA